MVCVGGSSCWLIYLFFQKLCAVPKPLPRSNASGRGKRGDGDLWEKDKRVPLEHSMWEKSSCLQACDLSPSLLDLPMPPPRAAPPAPAWPVTQAVTVW